MKSAVIQANIDLHTALAPTYAASEPHYSEENRAKVRSILAKLQQSCAGETLLDLGCGAGFIVGLAKDLFREVHGIDVTQAMMDQIDLSSGNITLHLGQAEALPFPDRTFDVVTGYAFLHHTEDYRKVLAEAFRVLKPGGVCYTAQDPNRAFWNAVQQLKADAPEPLKPLISKAYDAVHNAHITLEKEFGTPRELVQAAEPIRAVLGGLSAAEVQEDAMAIGFRSCDIRLEWFLGEGQVTHGQSSATAAAIDAHLRECAPLTDHLFKYVQLVLTK